MTAAVLKSRRLEVPDSFAAVQAYYEERGWTDGLPVVPATEDLVWEMLGTFAHNPAHSLGVIQPRNAPVDVLPALKDGASTAVFPSPIEGSGTTGI